MSLYLGEFYWNNPEIFRGQDQYYFTHFKSLLKGILSGLYSKGWEIDVYQIDFWGKKNMRFFSFLLILWKFLQIWINDKAFEILLTWLCILVETHFFCPWRCCCFCFLVASWAMALSLPLQMSRCASSWGFRCLGGYSWLQEYSCISCFSCLFRDVGAQDSATATEYPCLQSGLTNEEKILDKRFNWLDTGKVGRDRID